jgi:hypothetical protein
MSSFDDLLRRLDAAEAAEWEEAYARTPCAVEVRSVGARPRAGQREVEVGQVCSPSSVLLGVVLSRHACRSTELLFGDTRGPKRD